jgi:predicted lipoprotein
MFTQTKIALAVVLVLGTAFSASAATKTPAASNAQVAAYEVMPGYGSDGATVAIPNPDRR